MGKNKIERGYYHDGKIWEEPGKDPEKDPWRINLKKSFQDILSSHFNGMKEIHYRREEYHRIRIPGDDPIILYVAIPIPTWHRYR
jgi:hypothetical protein